MIVLRDGRYNYDSKQPQKVWRAIDLGAVSEIDFSAWKWSSQSTLRTHTLMSRAAHVMPTFPVAASH